MRVTMMLADAAQEANGKLYILGGGWSVTGPKLPPMAIALKVDVPWTEANRQHEWELVLTDADGRPATVGEEPGAREVRLSGKFEVGRPPGLAAGSDIDLAMAVNVGSLPLQPGRRYAWQLWIDGESSDDWRRPFSVRSGKG